MTFVLGQTVPSIAANIGEDLSVLIQTEKHKQTHTHTDAKPSADGFKYVFYQYLLTLSKFDWVSKCHAE